MTKYARFWDEMKYAVMLIGFVAVVIGAAGYAPETRQGSWGGYAVALGVGILLGWPAGGARFNFKANRSGKAIWTIVDLAVRGGIIFAIELVMRQLELRYAFKARIGVITMLACYHLYPAMPVSATSGEVKHKLAMNLLFAMAGTGLLVIAAAFSLHGVLINPLPELIGSLGVGLIIGPTISYTDFLSWPKVIWPWITIFILGLAATCVVPGLLTGWWCLLCMVVYGISTIAAATQTDRFFTE